jgi:hypothetical protein
MGDASLMRGGGGVEHSKSLARRADAERSAEARRQRRGARDVRVVRFTDVTAERVDGLLARIEESDAPPEGAPITGLQMLFDAAQGTAVVLQMFETAEDMRAGGEVFAAMEPTETPGTRASVDTCEVKLERRM